MQRIPWVQRPALRSSFSAGTRRNSTGVPTGTVKRTVRVPVSRLGDILIPSAEEVRAKAAVSSKPVYSADISYLDNASNNFLAAKLARLGRGETTKEESPNEHTAKKVSRPNPTSEHIAALTAKRREERKERTPKTIPRPNPTPEHIATLTAKRREERIARNARSAAQHLRNHVPVPEKSELLRSEFAKSAAFMSQERNIQHTRPKFEENLSRPSPQARGPPRDNLKQARPERRDERPRKQGPNAGQRKSRPPVAQSVTPSIHEQEIDEAVFQPGGHEPEFNGPERPSSSPLDLFGPTFSARDVSIVAQSGTGFKIPLSRVDSFYKGDYTRYVSASKEDYASPPDALGAVTIAKRTLSHQRHYDLNARDRTLELVAQASQPSKPVAKPPSRR